MIALAGVLVALIVFPRQKTLLEIVELSEAIVTAKVQAYYRQPSASNFQAVTDAIANYRQAIERADLSRDQRAVTERNLDEQI